jgi:hypothetical protein
MADKTFARIRFASILLVVAAPALIGPGIADAQPKKPLPTAGATADQKKATDLFKKATDALGKKAYAEALELFKQSYALVPSPNSHLYMARCMALMGNDRAAYDEFSKVIEEADARAAAEPRYAQTRDSAKTERDEVGGRIALLSVNVIHFDESTTLKLNGDTVPRERWAKPVPLPPGAVEVQVESKSKPPAKLALTMAAGEKKELPFDVLAPPPGALGNTPAASATAVAPPPPSSGGKTNGMRIASYVAGGVGVLGLGIFAIEGLRANSTFSALKDECGAGPCPKGHVDEISKGKSQQTIANVGLVIGLVGLGAGVTLFVLSGKKKTETALMVGPSSINVNGTF